jgi:hypothetical protein
MNAAQGTSLPAIQRKKRALHAVTIHSDNCASHLSVDPTARLHLVLWNFSVALVGYEVLAPKLRLQIKSDAPTTSAA